MKRHNRAALAVAALALILPVSGCASLLSPHQTAEYQYNGGDGAAGDVGDVKVRGLMLIQDESGNGPAQMFFSLVNQGSTPAEVSLSVAGAEVTESVPAGGEYVQFPDSPISQSEPIIVEDLQAQAGDLVDVTVSAGADETVIRTQLLTDVLPYYEDQVPTQSPSDVPSDEATAPAGDATATPSEEATTGTASEESTQGTASGH
ncbi:hypothetical protein DFO66_104163 [Brevibacterium sanguinis]|uniref:Copper(I)-binding protein n=2 Tax=Brevibacterium TaxID=1696 RepID=A0A366ILR3_9MICO|nr:MULTISPECIES: hypothetical protein [Brevibacterium]RBP65578.1 hypothetical protein DFO66_104163 [Brevibacterium sanguinis]RBP72212.1 hypothetical protein DFO65_104169 [Brevibacterium celere]